MKKETLKPGDQRRVPLSQLAGMKLPDNPKLHATDTLDSSVEEWGFADDITINLTTGHVVGGNGRVELLEALKQAGEPPPDLITEVDGEWMVPALFGAWPEEEEGPLSLALNRVGEVGGYDRGKLRAKLESLVGKKLAATGWTEEDKAALREELEGAGEGLDLDEEGGGTDYNRDLVFCPKCGFRFALERG